MPESSRRAMLMVVELLVLAVLTALALTGGLAG